MTIVYLVRHAHAPFEPSEERPLSEAGRADAAALAKAFGTTALSAIYSSPARRALETIDPLARSRGLRPEVVPDLRERELVVAAGATFEATVEAAWRAPDLGVGGSESNRAAADRGRRVLQEVLSAHGGEAVVLSTHGNLLALILHGQDPTHGYETWRSMTFPDVYRLAFDGTKLLQVDRVWSELW
ncbi:MAG TPA: histidine phosphatase family protein [Vicinamibacteria bacterium]